MKPSELQLDGAAPERALITSRAETHEAAKIALGLARRTVRCLHRDLSVFDLASIAAIGLLQRLLLSHRSARVQLLVDDAGWLESQAARLRAAQRRFPHALEIRIASADDPVGEDACLLVDDHAALVLEPSATTRGDLWIYNKLHAQPFSMAFDRRWNAGGHNIAVVPLGLG
ncbi:MAG TPA: hypothetical protein VMK32_12910 [Burkholderiaceae bacterium]|nr:hypothetical protein [Burkholderiaceae bacterium]